MKIQEAHQILLSQIGQPLCTSRELSSNKGRHGHSYEKLLGLPLGSHHLDFEDGELKSCAIYRGKMKEDFKICKVWDKSYIESKLSRILLVCHDYETSQIVSVQTISILDHPIIRRWFDAEINYLLAQPDIRLVSQSQTQVFIAKTNDTGHKAINDRALYISSAPWSYIAGLPYPARARKGKSFIKEMEQYEQTNSRCAA